MRRVGLLLLLPLFLAGCWGRYGWHQELRLSIASPHGDVEASTEQAVEAQYWPEWLQINGFAVDRTLTGEAVVADLGDGRYLFALLAGPGLAEGVYRDLGVWPEVFGEIEDQLGAPPRDVPRDRWPTLVTFADIDDPASVMRVDPDDLAAVFGEGYALRAVTLEITDAPVTTGVVEGVLGWWCDYRAEYFVDRYGDHVSNDFAREIGGSHFKIGECI
jgi:hypothetical protein